MSRLVYRVDPVAATGRTRMASCGITCSKSSAQCPCMAHRNGSHVNAHFPEKSEEQCKSHSAACLSQTQIMQKKKKNHYIFSSQHRADQLRGGPGVYGLFLDRHLCIFQLSIKLYFCRQQQACCCLSAHSIALRGGFVGNRQTNTQVRKAVKPLAREQECPYLLPGGAGFCFLVSGPSHLHLSQCMGVKDSLLLSRGETHLAHPAEVGQRIEISVFHGAGLGALRCHKQAGLIQLSRQLGLHLRVLRDQIPACADTSTMCSYAPCRPGVQEQPNMHIQCSICKQPFTTRILCSGTSSLYGVQSKECCKVGAQ